MAFSVAELRGGAMVARVPVKFRSLQKKFWSENSGITVKPFGVIPWEPGI